MKHKFPFLEDNELSALCWSFHQGERLRVMYHTLPEFLRAYSRGKLYGTCIKFNTCNNSRYMILEKTAQVIFYTLLNCTSISFLFLHIASLQNTSKKILYIHGFFLFLQIVFREDADKDKSMYTINIKTEK